MGKKYSETFKKRAIEKAMLAGARQAQICEILGVCQRTWQRWKSSGSTEDGRTSSKKTPANKLSELEVGRILKVANEDRFSNLPPKKIVPKLADEGIYIASESSFYRILKAADQLKHRNQSSPPRKVIKPMEIISRTTRMAMDWLFVMHKIGIGAFLNMHGKLKRNLLIRARPIKGRNGRIYGLII